MSEAQRPSVRHTVCVDRIAALPRRKLDEDTADAWAACFTDELLAPGARERARAAGLPDPALRRWQGMCFAEAAAVRGGFFVLPVGFGKALAHGEPVLTPSGYVPVESLRVGDHVIGKTGEPVRVDGVFPQGERDVWRVTFTDGVSVLCDGSHLWTFKTPSGGAGKRREYWYTRTTEEWACERFKRPCGDHTAHRVFAPMVGPVQMPHAELPLDPYTLGVLLGDGGMTQKTANITSMDPDI